MNGKAIAIQTMPRPVAMKPVPPQTLFERIVRVHQDIARRAFEIFESEGSLFGRDWDHWFRAEAELLHPVHLSITDCDDTLTVRAEVPGFKPNELKVSVEPRRLAISGKKETGKVDKKKEKIIYQDRCASELLRTFDLPVEVDPARATAKLKNGVLELDMPKAAKAKGTRVEVKAV